MLLAYQGFDIMSEDAKDTLNSGSYVQEMQPLWFGGGPDYDKLCQKFIPTVRDGGKGLLQTDNEYNWDNVDGKLAKLILFDQISRNAFRGTDEAFEYDTLSLEIARELAAKSLSDEPSFFASYNFFLVVALMHSENLEDHQLGAQCIDKAKLACSGIQWESTRKFLLEHTEVIDLFGRYPHRNKKKGRESTKEEVDWLKSENVPGWAKSQG
jgi:uncharacterized protein (DUF924 family)